MPRAERLDPKDVPYPIAVHLGSRCKLAEVLAPCDDWEGADYRWPNPVPEWRRKHAIACRLFFTGAKVIRWEGSLYRRGKIVWVHDGEDEPDTESPCLIAVDTEGFPIQAEAHHASR